MADTRVVKTIEKTIVKKRCGGSCGLLIGGFNYAESGTDYNRPWYGGLCR